MVKRTKEGISVYENISLILNNFPEVIITKQGKKYFVDPWHVTGFKTVNKDLQELLEFTYKDKEPMYDKENGNPYKIEDFQRVRIDRERLKNTLKDFLNFIDGCDDEGDNSIVVYSKSNMPLILKSGNNEEHSFLIAPIIREEDDVLQQGDKDNE